MGCTQQKTKFKSATSQQQTPGCENCCQGKKKGEVKESNTKGRERRKGKCGITLPDVVGGVVWFVWGGVTENQEEKLESAKKKNTERKSFQITKEEAERRKEEKQSGEKRTGEALAKRKTTYGGKKGRRKINA